MVRLGASPLPPSRTGQRTSGRAPAGTVENDSRIRDAESEADGDGDDGSVAAERRHAGRDGERPQPPRRLAHAVLPEDAEHDARYRDRHAGAEGARARDDGVDPLLE